MAWGFGNFRTRPGSLENHLRRLEFQVQRERSCPVKSRFESRRFEHGGVVSTGGEREIRVRVTPGAPANERPN